jgi:UDP-glucose 4-epimerase
MKVLILGVAGFLGRYIAQEFFLKGSDIIGLDMVNKENAPSNFLSGYYQLTLPSASLTSILKQHKPDICIHTIGRASVGYSLTQPTEDFAATVDVTLHLLDTIRLAHPLCKTIFLSSAAVYGNPISLPISESHLPKPISPYGYHKLVAELLCQEYAMIFNLPVAIVRIFSAYGPGLRRQVLWDLSYKIATRKVLTILGTGEESRDFIHARDIAAAISLITAKDAFAGDIYNLASGRDILIKSLAQKMVSLWQKNIPIEFDNRNPDGYPKKWQADISKLNSLGFIPKIDIDSGIDNYIQWYKNEMGAIKI